MIKTLKIEQIRKIFNSSASYCERYQTILELGIDKGVLQAKLVECVTEIDQLEGEESKKELERLYGVVSDLETRIYIGLRLDYSEEDHYRRFPPGLEKNKMGKRLGHSALDMWVMDNPIKYNMIKLCSIIAGFGLLVYYLMK